MKCPKCGSKRIKQSHARSFQERLQKLFNQKPYRCIDCDWRGILKAKPFHNRQYSKEYILLQIITVIIIIIAIYLIVLYLDRKEPAPSYQSARIYKNALAYKEFSNNLNLNT
jgi:hypothetical protein